ncbi:MAG: S8 family serine peptidase, partial [candidate division WOR-3 bacterium]
MLAVATALALAGQFAPDRIIVKFRTDVAPVSDGSVITGLAEVDGLNRKWNIVSATPVFPGSASRLALKMGLNRVFVLAASGPFDVLQAVAEYRTLPNVEYAEPDHLGQAYVAPNDPRYQLQWGLKNTGQDPGGDHPGIPGCDIAAEPAWDIERGSRDIIIGHLDTGVDLDHPDFVSYYQASVIWRNWDEIPRNNADDDGNGYIDDTLGWNFVSNNNNPQDDSRDSHGNPLGHGTHTAGIAAAHADNSRGIAGTCWYSQVMPLKVLNSNGWGLYSWWASAIYYAVAKGARIINMSLGGTDTSTTLRNAVDYAWNSGVVVVASMGNDNNNVPHYPAAYDNVIAVGMTDNDDDRVVPGHNGSGTYGSCFGPWIDLMAPGNWIYSTGWNDTYLYMVGTSMAAPFVTGTAALLLSRNPDLTNNQVRNILCATAKDLGAPGFDTFYGFGRINAESALHQVQFLPGWTPETLLATSTNGCDEADVAVSGPNVHIVWTNRGATNSLYYIRSTDGGRQFDQPRQLTTYQHNWNSFYPHITVSGNRVRVVFQDTRGSHCGIYFKSSTDNGQNWSGDILISDSTVESYHPDISSSGDTVHVVWNTGYRRSTNGGSIWDAINTAVTGLAVACAGNKVYVVKIENISGTNQVKFQRYNGTSWEPAVQLSNASGPAYLNPDVAADGQFVYVVWDQDMDNDGTTEAIIFRRSTNQGVNWQTSQTLAILGDNYTYRNPRLAASQGRVDLVWWGDRDKYWACEVYYRHSSNSGVNWGNTYRLCYNGNFDEMPAVAANGDTVHVVWDRMANGTKTVFYIRKGLATTRHDVSAYRIISPAGTNPAGTMVTPQAKVRNLGSTSESFSVRFQIGAAYSHDTTVTALPAGDSVTVTFSSWT